MTHMPDEPSDLRDLARRLARQNELFAAALDNMGQGLCMFDEEQRLIVCNRRYLELYGFSAEVIVPGITLREIMEHSVAIGNYSREVADEALSSRPEHADLRDERTLEQTLRDGRIIAVKHRPLANGGSIAIYEDVTELKRREAELMVLSEQLTGRNGLFETALNSMIQGLCMFDSDHRLILCNDRYLDMYGFSPEEVRPGKTLSEILEYSISLGNYSAADAERLRNDRPMQAAHRERSVHEQQLTDGRVIAVMHEPMANGGSVATYQDITELKRREEDNFALARKAATAQAASRDKTAFMARMSRELMSQLDSLRSAAASGSSMNNVVHFCDEMRALAATVQDLSLVETGGLEINDNEVDIPGLVTECFDIVRYEADLRGIELVLDGPLPEARLRADPRKLTGMLAKVLSHAVQTSLADGRVRLSGGIDGNGDICLRVSDAGVGYGAEDVERIMQPYGQAEGPSAGPPLAGPGVGLPIARAIAERHGGRLAVKSKPGDGTTVLVRLPKFRVLADKETETVTGAD